MADRYSFSLTTFSPSGKLKQIEHALAAVNQGVTAIGIKASNGVVLATEKRSKSILTESTNSKIGKIGPDCGMTYAGMGPDFRVLVEKARKQAHSDYLMVYGQHPPAKVAVAQIARVMQEATQSPGVRPFGVSLLVAGHDCLYQVDPSGAFFPWKATAVGKNASAAKTFLEKRWNEELELEDAIHMALLALKECSEGELSGESVELCVVADPDDTQLGFTGVEGAQGSRVRVLAESELGDRIGAL
ncbi:proteasome core particle subunit alpha 2 [Martiniozyma asiatica (nom. inval.)]|nr:proteasome core particle subunit alpha 2 [Martiniozyma asiatica]